MGKPKTKCYVYLRCLGPEEELGNPGVYEMQRVPELGEGVKGEELGSPGTSWEVQLVISDPKMVAMLAAIDAIDAVVGQGDGLALCFNRLLVAIMNGKRVI